MPKTAQILQEPEIDNVSVDVVEQCLSDARDYLVANGIARGTYLDQDLRCCSVGALGYASALFPISGDARGRYVFRSYNGNGPEAAIYVASHRALQNATGLLSTTSWNDNSTDETILAGFAKAIQWVRDYRAKARGANT